MGRFPGPPGALVLATEAAGRLAFRVSDAGRRQKVVGARTRGLQAVIYGDLSFACVWALNGATTKRTDLKPDGPFLSVG